MGALNDHCSLQTFDKYFSGDLSEQDAMDVWKHLAICAQCQSIAAEMSDALLQINAWIEDTRRAANPAVHVRPSATHRFLELLAQRPHGFPLSRAGALILATGALVLLFLSTAFWLAARHTWKNEVAKERSHSLELAAQLEQERDVTALQRESVSQHIVTAEPFVLTSAGDLASNRDLGSKPTPVQPAGELFSLVLPIKQLSHDNYLVAVKTVEGGEALTVGMLSAHTTKAGAAVVVTLPSDLLRENDYVISLRSGVSEKKSREVDSYFFRLLRKQKPQQTLPSLHP